MKIDPGEASIIPKKQHSRRACNENRKGDDLLLLPIQVCLVNAEPIQPHCGGPKSSGDLLSPKKHDEESGHR